MARKSPELKIAFIIPGSGASFYCQNCLRDFGLVRGLRGMGAEISVIPLYLPLDNENLPDLRNLPVFCGAVNIYLREKFTLYDLIPEAMRSMLASKVVLDFASGLSTSTSSKGLESLTISILEGTDGRHKCELDKLVSWLKNEEKPDIVHISNALLLGVAENISTELKIPVFCTVQDENQWIDSMDQEFREKIYRTMASKATSIKRFISVSSWYSEKFAEDLGIGLENISVIYPGVDCGNYHRSNLPSDPPVIAYLSRISEESGVGILAEAFAILKSQGGIFRNLKLKLSGGFSRGGKEFYEKIAKKMEKSGFKDDITIIEKFDDKSKNELLGGATVFSVPSVSPEAFGFEILEAFAAGVPAVLPGVGAYPEIVNSSGGGIIYSPNTHENLAGALKQILDDRSRLEKLSENAFKAAGSLFSIKTTAGKYMDMFSGCHKH